MKGATIRRSFRASRVECPARLMPKPLGPSRVTRQLALAHHIERLIEDGHLRDPATNATSPRIPPPTKKRLRSPAALIIPPPQEGGSDLYRGGGSLPLGLCLCYPKLRCIRKAWRSQNGPLSRY